MAEGWVALASQCRKGTMPQGLAYTLEDLGRRAQEMEIELERVKGDGK